MREVMRFRKIPACEAERRPVELVVADEAVVLAAARAREADAVDDGMRRALEPLELRKSDSDDAALAPRAGQANVYRLVSASYIAQL